MSEPTAWSAQVPALATAPLVVSLPYIAQQRVDGWPDTHPEDYCHRCGGRNISWWTDAETWQKIMPSPDPWNGIVCVNCFGELAEQIAPLQSWHLQLDTDTRHAAALKQAAEDRERLEKQAIDLPTGSVETHRITVLSYLDADGVNKYAVDAKGDAPMTSYLGLLVVAQRDVLGWGSNVEYY